MSKWVETAMRPVPERSHMLNTWPTKAGPPFPAEFKLEILTVEGNPEPEPEPEGDGMSLSAGEDEDGEDGESV